MERPWYESVQVYFAQALLTFKAIYGWQDTLSVVLVKVIRPVFQMMFFSMIAAFALGPERLSYYVIGNSVATCAATALFGVGNILRYERSHGTLGLIISSPYNKFLLFTGRAFFYVLDGLFTSSVTLLTGILFFRLDVTKATLGMGVLALFVSVISASTFGLLLGTLGLRVTDLNMVMNFASNGFLILCGINFPITELPLPLQYLSAGLPLTHGVAAMRLSFNGEPAKAILYLMGKELLVGFVCMVLGYVILRAAEYRARGAGTLDLE